MGTRRRRRPTLALSISESRHPVFRRLYEWRCPWCGDAYSSPTKDRVSGWAIRHLNAHLRSSAAKTASEAEA